ncbi:heterokaryon incompatibility protein-domain-containing protein [Ilyonectria robusta]|uniref:heterokaryon incompatibility protein-domain-containing protein n=1 Tax=Ilyonectria robusta TaxID=1079257 RepID=UPI001E8CF756|nr:heterokaryon incompatibility protein-domain-containing protein [Ilyonectria robusta]KAH8666127.1 heterokaryon incompatibility protein-domain-containing protein [Ilyonectria robusta]
MDDTMDIDSDPENIIDEQRLCRLCAGISADALVSPQGYAHATSPEDLANTSGDCDLCNILRAEVMPHTVSTFNTYDYGTFQNLRLGLNPQESRHESDSNALIATIDTPGIFRKSLEIIYVWTPCGDPASSHGIPMLNTDLTSTKSPQTFQFIQSCLDECSRHDCTVPLQPGSAQTTPSRLVDVGGASVRLVETGQTCPPYIALSHCWGSNLETYKTTSINLAQKKAAIYPQDLTPTFQDAIKITRDLGVRYIWIDALCIVQDSKEEWAHESVKMGDIYQNAFLTISASHARDGFGGCFNDKSVIGLGETSIAITTQTKFGQKSSIIMTSSLPSGPPRVVENSPINSRGWVYQERILSPRIIHFTSTQAIWECRKAYQLESLRPLTVPTTPSLIRRKNILDSVAAVEDWHQEIVKGYCERRFTKYEDRLVALSGIAQIYQNYTKDRYIAGLWASHLAYGLSWGHERRPDSPKSPNRRHPSWSWASHDGYISWRHLSGFSPDVEFSFVSENLDFYQTWRKEFSAIKGGYITIKGRSTQVTQFGDREISAFSDVALQMGTLSGRFWADNPAATRELSQKLPNIIALALGHIQTLSSSSLVLILVANETQGTGYLRVGYGIAWFDTPSDRVAFWDSCATQILKLF